MQAHSCPAGRTVSKRLNLGQDLVADPRAFSDPGEWPVPVHKLVPGVPPSHLPWVPRGGRRREPSSRISTQSARVTRLHAQDCRTWCKFLINKETHIGKVSATLNFSRNSFFGNWIAPTTSRHRCSPAQGVISASVDHLFQTEFEGGQYQRPGPYLVGWPSQLAET